MPTIAVIFATFYCHSYLDNLKQFLLFRCSSSPLSSLSESSSAISCFRSNRVFLFLNEFYTVRLSMHLFLFCPISVKQGFSFSKRLRTHYWSDFLFSVKQGYSFSKQILYSTSVYAPSLVQCTFSLPLSDEGDT